MNDDRQKEREHDEKHAGLVSSDSGYSSAAGVSLGMSINSSGAKADPRTANDERVARQLQDELDQESRIQPRAATASGMDAKADAYTHGQMPVTRNQYLAGLAAMLSLDSASAAAFQPPRRAAMQSTIAGVSSRPQTIENVLNVTILFTLISFNVLISYLSFKCNSVEPVTDLETCFKNYRVAGVVSGALNSVLSFLVLWPQLLAISKQCLCCFNDPYAGLPSVERDRRAAKNILAAVTFLCGVTSLIVNLAAFGCNAASDLADCFSGYRVPWLIATTLAFICYTGKLIIEKCASDRCSSFVRLFSTRAPAEDAFSDLALQGATFAPEA